MSIENISKEEKLKKIESELSGYIRSDQRNWINIYNLMHTVEQDELYKARPETKSFTSWVNGLAESMHVHVSLLWTRLKAGRVYSEYAERRKREGKEVAPIESLANVSPESINLCSTVAGKDADRMDALVDKVVSGELSRTDLREAARAKRASCGTNNSFATSRHDVITGENRVIGMVKKISADDIVLSLREKKDWIGDFNERNYIDRKYSVFTEFRADTGTSRNVRRMDALVVETMTEDERDAVKLRGIEIKVDKNDLLGDHKMDEYTEYCDYFYIAVPDETEIIEAAESVRLDSWGLLAIRADGTIDVKHPAAEKPGTFRDKTMAACIIKLL